MTIKEEAGPISFLNESNNIVLLPQLHYYRYSQDAFPLLDGPKEETFFLATQKLIFDFGPFNNSQAYYNAQGRYFIPISSDWSCITEGNEEGECVPNRYVNRTNNELNSREGSSFGGEIMPNNVFTHPMLIGGRATNVTGGNVVLEVEEEINDIFTLRPNPTDGSLTIDGDIVIDKIEVFTLTGIDVSSKVALKNISELDVSNLPSGVYLVKVTDNQMGERSVQRFIKR